MAAGSGYAALAAGTRELKDHRKLLLERRAIIARRSVQAARTADTYCWLLSYHSRTGKGKRNRGVFLIAEIQRQVIIATLLLTRAGFVARNAKSVGSPGPLFGPNLGTAACIGNSPPNSTDAKALRFWKLEGLGSSAVWRFISTS